MEPRQLVVQPGAGAPTIDYSAIPLETMARAAVIALEAQSNGKPLTPAQALAAAMHFTSTGEVYGRHSYVGTSGDVAGKVIEGYRAVAREHDMSKYQWRYRPLSDDEKTIHQVGQKDRSVACELTVLAARRQCIEMGIEYYPIIGITVIRDGQYLNVPKNRTAAWVLQKQARDDALRQCGENVSADDVLGEAGIDAPQGVNLSIEQAEAMVRARQALSAARARTDEEAVENAALNVAQMRGPDNNDPLGIDTQPERIPEPSGQTAGSEAEPVCPICGERMWDNRQRVAQAIADGKKPGPEWACKAGKYNSETRKHEGCDGKYWKGEWPQRSKPTDGQMQEILDLTAKIYPDKAARANLKMWFAQNFPRVEASTATSVKGLFEKLTMEEASSALANLREMLALIESIE